jgi:hypothetical protein
LKTLTAIALLCAHFCISAGAQSLRYSIAVPYTGLSAYSTQQNDPLSFSGNQAALAKTANAGVGIYGEKRFLLAATSAYSMAGALPTPLGNFGIQVNYSGFKNFNENKLGLAYARSLGSRVDAGIQFNYYGYSIPAYGHASAVYAEGGAILHLTGKLNAGIHVYNPFGTKLGKEGSEKLASVYKFGLGYDASEFFFVSGEIIKEEGKPVNVIAGMQYQFAKQFFARAGFLSESSTVFAGAGISWKNLRLDVAGSYHPQLGFTPGILIITNFENKKTTVKESEE